MLVMISEKYKNLRSYKFLTMAQAKQLKDTAEKKSQKNVKTIDQYDYLSVMYRPMFKTLDIIWGILPDYLGTIIATVLLFLAGSVLRGDWLFILVHFIKFFNDDKNITAPLLENQQSQSSSSSFSLKDYRLEGLSSFIIGDLTFAYTMYFFVCGFLQWYFYIRRRDMSHEWKCQPGKFLSPEVERHEIVLGSINVGFGGLIFATLACYIYNGGSSAIYFQPDEYGWTYLILSIPINFIYQDGGAYYCHRILHIPFFYKHFHKWHHYYKQPTAFSATAMHPAEMMFFQSFMIVPIFFVPIHFLVYIVTMIYIYYYGLISHSGIDVEPTWPWQPNVSYHDNHHQYFHVNFGSQTTLFDRLHGTLRQKDRVYNEKIFGGQGIHLKDASKELRKEHAQELNAELKSK